MYSKKSKKSSMKGKNQTATIQDSGVFDENTEGERKKKGRKFKSNFTILTYDLTFI